MRESHTAVLERWTRLHGHWETEPYEVAWADELIWFVHLSEPHQVDVPLTPQLSADGRRWVDDTDAATVLPAGVTDIAVRQRHFGGWSRLVLDLPSVEGPRIDIYLSAKE